MVDDISCCAQSTSVASVGTGYSPEECVCVTPPKMSRFHLPITKVFLALCKLYALHEARLLRFLQMVFSRPHHTVLFGPAFDSSFFNVRDATLDVYSLLDHGHLHLEERVKFDGLDGWQSCLSYSTFHPRSFQVSSKKSTLEEKPSIAHLTPKS